MKHYYNHCDFVEEKQHKPVKKMNPKTKGKLLTGAWIAFVFGFIMYSIPKVTKWVMNPYTMPSKVGKVVAVFAMLLLTIHLAYEIWGRMYEEVVYHRW